jgi:predicted alpha-1,2-mannosidase
VLVNPASNQVGVADAAIRFAGSNEIDGWATSGWFCGMPGTYTVYFALRFDRPFLQHGTWSASNVMAGQDAINGSGTGGWATFDTTVQPVVRMKAALSWVSIAGARANLDAEAHTWDVEQERASAARSWRSELERIRVDGGTPQQLRTFYTALYHAMLHPNVYSDANGMYRGFDGFVHHVDPGHTEYATFSGWDIYRTQIPLVAMLEPNRTSDMMRSLVHAAAQMGWLPKWSLVNVESGVMGGDPADPILAGAYAFGARDFDAQRALAAMIKAATQADATPGQGWYIERPSLQEYASLGYVVNDHATNVSPVANGASLTLEYAFDDFSIAQLASSLGESSVARTMMARASNWSTLFNTSSGLIAPRDRDDAFTFSPITRHGQDGFQEGNAAQYSWMVPHDMARLIDGMGGNTAASSALDTFFLKLDAGPDEPYAWLGNEPTITSPWAYAFAQAPWKAQRVVRDAINQLWGDTPDGLPGNDDLGTMSAWYVWSTLGLYPQNPAVPVLVLGTPLFKHAQIRVPGGANIEILAPSAATDNEFIQSVHRNGQPWTRSWIPFTSAPVRLDIDVSSAPALLCAWTSTSVPRPTKRGPPSQAMLHHPTNVTSRAFRRPRRRFSSQARARCASRPERRAGFISGSRMQAR